MRITLMGVVVSYGRTDTAIVKPGGMKALVRCTSFPRPPIKVIAAMAYSGGWNDDE